MKKGFTLIELLAVIVILAIIALIATPIILGIINDARKESNERSAELYASSVKNAIASYQLTHPNAPTTFEDLDVEYDGNVACDKEELYADGSFYIADCTVNGDTVEYTYGEQQELPSTQVYKPQYYTWSYGYIEEELPSEAKPNVSEIDTKSYPFYLGLDVDVDNKVTVGYICFIRNNSEYCLKYDSYETNVEIIKDAFKDVIDTEACSFEDDYFVCDVGELSAGVFLDGGLSVGNDIASCGVYDAGCAFLCKER